MYMNFDVISMLFTFLPLVFVKNNYFEDGENINILSIVPFLVHVTKFV